MTAKITIQFNQDEYKQYLKLLDIQNAADVVAFRHLPYDGGYELLKIFNKDEIVAQLIKRNEELERENNNFRYEVEGYRREKADLKSKRGLLRRLFKQTH